MKKLSAFSLIELMIVVAIMALLAMIAVTKYTTYVERGRDSAVQSLLQNLVLAQSTLKTNANEDNFLPVSGSTAIVSLTKLSEYGFRPDPEVGFVGLPFDGEEAGGFVLFGAYVSPGARIFVYNFVPRAGVRAFDPAAGYAAALPAAIEAYQWQGSTANKVATLSVNSVTGLVSSVTRP